MISSETELYDKWSQALTSAGELVGVAAQVTVPNGTAHAFVMPVLLVNDGALWTDYAEDGTRSEPHVLQQLGDR